jgi:hypothetical protein
MGSWWLDANRESFTQLAKTRVQPNAAFRYTPSTGVNGVSKRQARPVQGVCYCGDHIGCPKCRLQKEYEARCQGFRVVFDGWTGLSK